MNVTEEPWFDQVVGCGLADVKVGHNKSAICKPVQVDGVAKGVVAAFGAIYEKDTEKLDVESAGKMGWKA